uniref:Uncharacterized protein n=1 Tax=Anguilla anguilla TaxID=7936 RepID=A0A0E9UJX3_ANGAN
MECRSFQNLRFTLIHLHSDKNNSFCHNVPTHNNNTVNVCCS